MMNLRELVAKYPEVMSAEVSDFGNGRWATISLGKKTIAKLNELRRIRRAHAQKLLKHLYDQGYRFRFSHGGAITTATRTDEQNELPFYSKTGCAIASKSDTRDAVVGEAIAAARSVEFWDGKTGFLFNKLVNPGS